MLMQKPEQIPRLFGQEPFYLPRDGGVDEERRFPGDRVLNNEGMRRVDGLL